MAQCLTNSERATKLADLTGYHLNVKTTMKISRTANVGARAIIQLAMNKADESDFDKVIPGKVSVEISSDNH